jgi:hypothetical protein
MRNVRIDSALETAPSCGSGVLDRELELQAYDGRSP